MAIECWHKTQDSKSVGPLRVFFSYIKFVRIKNIIQISYDGFWERRKENFKILER
jgi:hypothetical protein